ncbi:MAG: DUF6288 domain-containing protein [Planctomycetaceae bacterium]
MSGQHVSRVGRVVGLGLALVVAVATALAGRTALAIMERGGYPWNVTLRSFHDDVMKAQCPEGTWLLNLGPTGIRARIYPEKPNVFVVKYVFQDAKSPAKGKVEIGDVIVGANGRTFTTPHRFGRNLPGGGGWDGPLMELAAHLENSQDSKDGLLELVVWPKGDAAKERKVVLTLRKVGRFAPTFPYDCPRSKRMLEELCDFLVADYLSGNWKGANSFYGDHYGKAHSMLALMGSGLPKYTPILQKEIAGYYGLRYNPEAGGFQCWKWGFDGIVMGEYYLLTKDPNIVPAIKSVAEAMPLGCHAGNGIYTHRPYLAITRSGAKPYASIAAISGLNMIAMSLFKKAGLPYDEKLHDRIHQHYLNSTSPTSVDIAYGFGTADKFNPPDILPTHAVIKLKDPAKGASGRGPGYLCPTGMKGIGDYELVWPTKADPRWKPTEWIAAEAATNIVTELKEPGFRQVDRRNPRYRETPEPTGPFQTSRSGGHLAPVGMGALAHLIGNEDKPTWRYLGHHAATTCALGPGNAFDGHAASNLHAFWSILGAARSDNPQVLRAYFNYMKTFLILSETHDGGLILQPWGRDRPDCNSDVSYGPRILPTATGAILLALGEGRLQITGADLKAAATSDKGAKGMKGRKPTPAKKPPVGKPAKPGAEPEEPRDDPPSATAPAEPAAKPPAPKLPPLPVPPPPRDGEEDSPLDALMRQLNAAGGQAPAAPPAAE